MRCSRWFAGAAAVLMLAGGWARAAGLPDVQAVSLADPALPLSVTANGFSASPVLSSNGQFVAFVSQANNLTPTDAAGNGRGRWLNVFVRNLASNQTALVSVTPDGSTTGNDDSSAVVMSADGRFVVFESRASNLVTNDANGVSDIFVRDLQAGVTRLVSVNAAGTGSGDGVSSNPSLTPDGRWVVFESAADDLVPNDTNGIPDIFVRDLQTGTTILVSTNAQASFGGGGESDSPVITPDGRWVAFVSTATNLVTGVTNIQGDVYARDLVDGTTYWVSTNAAAIAQSTTTNVLTFVSAMNPVISDDGRYAAYTCTPGVAATTLVLRQDLQSGVTDVIATNGPGNGDFTGPAISADGRFVAYTAISLVTSNANVFLWDAQTGTNTLVSVNLAGTGPGEGTSDTPALSPDGQSLAFLSDASDLATNPVDGNFHLYLRNLTTGVTRLIDVDRTGGAQGDLFEGGAFNGDGNRVAFESLDDQIVTNDLNAAFDVFVRDVTNQTTTLVSARDPGLPVLTANGSSVMAPNALSADGRWAVFTSDATNLVAGDTNGVQDVFVHDLLAGTNLLVSVNTNGLSAGGASSSPVISADGRFVAFVSLATDLAPGDTNSLPDVYLRDLQAGTTTLISVNQSGTAAGVIPTASPLYVCSISPDGRFVAFTSNAAGITSNTIPLGYTIYVRDVGNGTTVKVPPLNPSTPSPGQLLSPLSRSGSLFFSSAGVPISIAYFDYPTGLSRLVGAYSLPPAVSANSRFLAFQFLSFTTNQVSVYDTVTGSNTLVSSAAGNRFTAPTANYRLAVSDDGRYVAFVCDFGNLVANDTNQAPDVFVADAQNPGQLTLVSVNQEGTGPGNAGSDSPMLSRDGRFVAFRSFATDLVAEPTDGQPNVYLRDLVAGTTALLSGNRAGSASGNGRSSMPVISADGATVFFSSDAPDLVVGDFNDFQDLFYWNNPATAGRAFPSITGGAPTITWTTVPGLVYRVEYKSGLGDTNAWTALSGDVTASGPTAAKSDPGTVGTAQRLYRVRLVQ